MIIHPIFQACCAETEEFYKIGKPFVEGPYLYATDGHIGVRQASAPERTVERSFPNTRRPDIASVFDGKFYPNPAPVPQVDYPTKKAKCYKCNGSGRIPEDGDLDSHFVTCDLCKGTKLAWPWAPVVVVGGRMGFGARYLALLQAHDAILFLPRGSVSVAAKWTVGSKIEGRLIPAKLPKGDA